MSVISSENVKVFPSVGRVSQADVESSLMTEKNLTNAVNGLYPKNTGVHDSGSFVVSASYEKDTSDETHYILNADFYLSGYHFILTNVSDDGTLIGKVTPPATDDLKHIYAIVNIGDTDTNMVKSTYQQLVVSADNKSQNSAQGNIDIVASPADITKDTFIGLDLRYTVTSTSLSNTEHAILLLSRDSTDDSSTWKVPVDSTLQWDTQNIRNRAITADKVAQNTYIDNISLSSTLSDRTLQITLPYSKNS